MTFLETEESFELYRFPTSRGGKPRYERQDRGFDTPCWIWLMWVEPKMGYAYSKVLGTPAHRALYKLLVCDLPRSIALHHRCEQPACVNPGHLQEMTHAAHNALHKTGKKLNISEEERARRRERGRYVGKNFGARPFRDGFKPKIAQ